MPEKQKKISITMLKLGMSTNRDFDIRIFGHPFERIFEYSFGHHSMYYRCLRQSLLRENTTTHIKCAIPTHTDVLDPT